MSGKTLIHVETPVTQSVAAIKALLQWKGRASNPLPQFVELGKEESRLVLVLSNKKDAYYCTTPRVCSCPAHTWHPGTPCKHQRKFFPVAKVEQVTETGSIRPAGKWPGGMNGPVDECKGAA
jgi:hypothetical protein